MQTINIQKFFLPILSGVLLTGAFPKADINMLAWFALIPLFYSLAETSPKESFRMGFTAGLAHYLSLMYWLVYTMQTYGNLPIWLAVPLLFLLAAYLSLYIGFFSMIISWLTPGSFFNFALIPFLWVSFEYARSFLLTGFPWELLGYSQYKNLYLIQISDIFGVYGVSFLILMANIMLLLVFLNIKKKKWQNTEVKVKHALTGIICFITAMGMTILYSQQRIEYTEKIIIDAPKINTGFVQGNIDQMVKWDPDFQKTSTQKYIDLIINSKKQNPELIVWPETAAPFYFMYNPSMTDMIIKAVQNTKAYHIIGSPSFKENKTEFDYYNSAFLVTPEGNTAGRYDKVHLVPFGEYVPLKKWLPFINKIVAQVGDFKTGKKGDTLIMDNYSLGILICYEIIFPELSGAAARNEADLLINITNDAWYGTTSAPYQHFSMAVFRAVENKRSLVRSANTGISGFIDPLGRTYNLTHLFQEAVMTKALPVIKYKTIYAEHGDIFAVTCLAFTFIVSFIHIYRRKKI
ncbi:Apolipoprotein N-acyltransferase [Desulfonema limicola]|uniref:Apolipoprotein N-acyltransferase n=1 Tax=Desulfonema limicola TaxID=45656 RepID=A0A975GJF8_9BACT|nr:apolipoprotein N-acyltransferase [Desulfonema limicola]QTA82993.1 Apolipoprotein N-acyltransferase [Desulfonema limicola]